MGLPKDYKPEVNENWKYIKPHRMKFVFYQFNLRLKYIIYALYQTTCQKQNYIFWGENIIQTLFQLLTTSGSQYSITTHIRIQDQLIKNQKENSYNSSVGDQGICFVLSNINFKIIVMNMLGLFIKTSESIKSNKNLGTGK